MKKILLFLVITVASFGCINAQSAAQNSTPEARAKRMVVAIHKAVMLHGNEFGVVNDAYVEYFRKLDALNAHKSSLRPAVYQSHLTELQNARDAKVKAGLEPAQVKGWQTYHDRNPGK
jgi:LmbE family N-acetylglucosaminyl deacetylase